MSYPLLSVPYRWRAVVLSAVRTWRLSTDSGALTQPALHNALDRHGCGILAPNFDSLMRLDESFHGRRFRTAAAGALDISIDEGRLLASVAGLTNSPAVATRGGQTAGLAAALDVALHSTRLMMGMALQRGEAKMLLEQRWLMRSA